MMRNRFRLPAPTPPAPEPGAFVLTPFTTLPGTTPEVAAWQQALYQWAFEQAQAVVTPSILERDLLGVWN